MAIPEKSWMYVADNDPRSSSSTILLIPLVSKVCMLQKEQIAQPKWRPWWTKGSWVELNANQMSWGMRQEQWQNTYGFLCGPSSSALGLARFCADWEGELEDIQVLWRWRLSMMKGWGGFTKRMPIYTLGESNETVTAGQKILDIWCPGTNYASRWKKKGKKNPLFFCELLS